MAAELKPVKQRKCKARGCVVRFEPWNSFQDACSVPCARALHREREAKRLRGEKRAGRILLMTRSDHMALTQKAFNAWIRERDKNRPCISCGRTKVTHQLRGGFGWVASHYRSVGAHPELRFDESNVHKACVQCNSHLSGNVVEYRISLMARIGTKAVDWLEGPHEPKKYTVEELIAIRSECVRKRKNSLLAALA